MFGPFHNYIHRNPVNPPVSSEVSPGKNVNIKPIDSILKSIKGTKLNLNSIINIIEHIEFEQYFSKEDIFKLPLLLESFFNHIDEGSIDELVKKLEIKNLSTLIISNTTKVTDHKPKNYDNIRKFLSLLINKNSAPYVFYYLMLPLLQESPDALNLMIVSAGKSSLDINKIHILFHQCSNELTNFILENDGSLAAFLVGEKPERYTLIKKLDYQKLMKNPQNLAIYIEYLFKISGTIQSPTFYLYEPLFNCSYGEFNPIYLFETLAQLPSDADTRLKLLKIRELHNKLEELFSDFSDSEQNDFFSFFSPKEKQEIIDQFPVLKMRKENIKTRTDSSLTLMTNKQVTSPTGLFYLPDNLFGENRQLKEPLIDFFNLNPNPKQQEQPQNLLEFLHSQPLENDDDDLFSLGLTEPQKKRKITY